MYVCMYVCVCVCIYDYICILISMSSEMSKHVVQYLITERKARFAYCKVDQDSSRLFSAGPYDGFKQRESEMLHGAHGAALGALAYCCDHGAKGIATQALLAATPEIEANTKLAISSCRTRVNLESLYGTKARRLQGSNVCSWLYECPHVWVHRRSPKFDFRSSQISQG